MDQPLLFATWETCQVGLRLAHGSGSRNNPNPSLSSSVKWEALTYPVGQEDQISWCQGVWLRSGCMVITQDLLATVLVVAIEMVAEVEAVRIS